ncbi:MAG TPA: sugar diacid recognition domain-containing protein [Pseudogracilibacillus sp.]|nr:sugar diacid recognition domain-containing protein [Pseudogracilibacillus sp.]
MVLRQIAQKISDITTQIIGFPVSISDENGYLIGVNNESRIGLYDHLLAEVIRTKKLTFYDDHAADQYPGIYSGVASPIIVNNKVLGAVGIIGKTGDDTESRNYINLVRNHIEMMCHDALRKELQSLESNALDMLIHYVLNFDKERHDEEQIRRYGNMMGYNIDLPRTCIIIQLTNTDEVSQKEDNLIMYDEIFDLLNQLFLNDKEDIIGRLTFEQYCILKTNNEETNKNFMTRVKQHFMELNHYLQNQFHISAVVSVGNEQSGVEGIKRSYENALLTLHTNENINKTDKQSSLLSYNNLTNKMNIMMTMLPDDLFDRVQDAFRPLTLHNNYEVMADTFINYCESKFNLSVAARNLFIHRNSLIYRLNQISKITGIDLEDFNQCMLLYLYIKTQL